MTSTGKSKMLVLLVVVLLLTNAGMLYFLLKNSSEEKKSKEQKQVEYMKKELRLDDNQYQKYLGLRHKRDSVLVPLYDSLRESKMKIIDYLRQPVASVPDSLVLALENEISAKQQKIDLEYYRHFRRIHGICRPDQLSLFDSVLVKMVNRTTNKPEGKK